MKRIWTIIAVVIAISVTVTSCTASKGGCKSTQGMVGYR